MANNRMYLTCTVCNQKILLAKYYPGSPWYLFEPYEYIIKNEEELKNPEWIKTDCFENIFNTFMMKHKHYNEIHYDCNFGPTHFKLEFEIIQEE